MRLKAIACEIAYREACYCAAVSRNIVDLEFVQKGWHDVETQKMCAELQRRIDKTETVPYDAILLLYGLCNNGVARLRAPAIPLVIPRAHDCITFFFGSRERYQEYFDSHPGTYFITTGWKERNAVKVLSPPQTIMGQLGLNRTYQEYVEKYGEENARFIMETIGGWTRNYSRYAYIEMGLADFLGYDAQTAEEAQNKGWEFERITGDISLIKKLFDGDWNPEDFLVVKPGEKICSTGDHRIIEAQPVEDSS